MSLPTTQISTTNLDAGSDNPRDARAELLEAIQNLNAIIENIDLYSASQGNSIANDLLTLDTSSKIVTTKLVDRVNVGNLENGSVEKNNFFDANSTDKGITNSLIANNTIPTSKLNFVSTTLTTSNTLIPTETAVVNFANSYAQSATVLSFKKSGSYFHNGNTSSTATRSYHYPTSLTSTISPASNYGSISGNTVKVLKGGWYIAEYKGDMTQSGWSDDDDSDLWIVMGVEIFNQDGTLIRDIDRKKDAQSSAYGVSSVFEFLTYISPNSTIRFYVYTEDRDIDAYLENPELQLTLYDFT
jgi:hypothetical protein